MIYDTEEDPRVSTKKDQEPTSWWPETCWLRTVSGSTVERVVPQEVPEVDAVLKQEESNKRGIREEATYLKLILTASDATDLVTVHAGFANHRRYACANFLYVQNSRLTLEIGMLLDVLFDELRRLRRKRRVLREPADERTVRFQVNLW
ncbi:uncharacterized protein LOC119766051 [Culex quinquefasciatus]|uniref:uncharacterized protein LOC119766051 n=1 Tax=Culex quinquefasciatus TaxID=7176 RepID=UPI0018E3B00A|nr:uncharacterized protein LOC119766051 [Culex quinquefasciatus]